MPKVTAARARELLEYNPLTGICVWRGIRSGVTSGTPAGSLRPDGYIQVSIDGKRYGIHRVIFLIVTGEWPSEEIDHRDLDKSNNRWDNLRQATSSQNKGNLPMRKNNKSGYKGVFLLKGRYWRASISIDSKPHYLGIFQTAEEAHAAYCAASEKGFGEFSRAS